MQEATQDGYLHPPLMICRRALSLFTMELFDKLSDFIRMLARPGYTQFSGFKCIFTSVIIMQLG